MDGNENYRVQPRGSFEFNRPIVVSLLLLLTYFTGFSALVGVVVAYVWRKDAEPWEASHHTYLIRSFWLGLLYLALSGALLAFLVTGMVEFGREFKEERGALAIIAGAFGMIGGFAGALGILGTALWFAVRCVLSLVNAMPHQEMPRPRTWWL
jgi:uncharacterized membrane protein